MKTPKLLELLKSPFVQRLPLTLLLEQGIGQSESWSRTHDRLTQFDAQVQIWQAAKLIKAFFDTYGDVDEGLVNEVSFRIVKDGEFLNNYFYVDGQGSTNGHITMKAVKEEGVRAVTDFLDERVARHMFEIDGLKTLVAVNDHLYDFPSARLRECIGDVEEALERSFYSQADAEAVISQYTSKVEARVMAHLMDSGLVPRAAASAGPRFRGRI